MVAVTEPVLGVDTEQTYDHAAFALGHTVATENGGEYVFVLTTGAVAADHAVIIDESYNVEEITTTNADLGDLVGVADVAMASGEYGWVCRKGVHDVQVAASCAANTVLNTTAIGGQLDDASTTTVPGIVLTAARAASAGTAPAILNFPAVGA